MEKETNEKYVGELIESDAFDHSEAEAERLQEKADVAREQMAEDSVRKLEMQCERDVRNAIAINNLIMSAFK